jgi:hypothetical protein
VVGEDLALGEEAVEMDVSGCSSASRRKRSLRSGFKAAPATAEAKTLARRR